MKKKFVKKGQTRFKVPVISTVKSGAVRKRTKAVKLAVGESLVARNESSETEEGFSSVYEVFENCGGTLHRVIEAESADCDGRYSSSKSQKLIDGEWHTIDASQRDYTAESQGY